VPAELEHAARTSINIAMKINASGDDAENTTDARCITLDSPLFETRGITNTEEDMLAILDWRIDPPTMHHFAMSYIQLHPLRRRDAHLSDYIYEMTAYQIEQAIFSRELMMNYKPSVIAYAAMLRAGEELSKRVFTDEMRDKFFSLEEILNADPRHVQEAVFALENNIPNIPSVEEFQGFRVGGSNPTRAVPTETRNEDVSALPTDIDMAEQS
jgi:hypothetical protein